jgi:hypothetical protein
MSSGPESHAHTPLHPFELLGSVLWHTPCSTADAGSCGANLGFVGCRGGADRIQRDGRAGGRTVVLLVVLWLLGFSFHVGGGLIHLLLLVALVVLAFNFLGGRRRG